MVINGKSFDIFRHEVEKARNKQHELSYLFFYQDDISVGNFPRKFFFARVYFVLYLIVY